MPHSMRLGAVIIDCRADDLSDAADWWGAMLGVAVEIDSTGRYARIQGPPGHPPMILQAVDHAPRVHLDFETDDIPAEIARQEALGATVVAHVASAQSEDGDWVVMQAPTGHRYCLIPPQRADFPGDGTVFE